MYSREINGEVLTLAATGWTYNNTFVLYDKETESLWYHFGDDNQLVCVNGRYADEVLPERFSTRLRWNEWWAAHPDTKFLLCKKVNRICAQPR